MVKFDIFSVAPTGTSIILLYLVWLLKTNLQEFSTVCDSIPDMNHICGYVWQVPDMNTET